MKLNKCLRITLSLFLISGVLWQKPWTLLHPAHPLAGYALQTPHGTPLNLSALKGKTVILNFWATWCPPCIEEMPDLNALHPELQSKNIELLGIAIDSLDNVQEFLAKTPVNYPIIIATTQGLDMLKDFGNTQGGLPYTVILDEHGKQILTKAGRIHQADIKNTLFR
jgi:thiol-disulfide isomerase/thioredoxin